MPPDPQEDLFVALYPRLRELAAAQLRTHGRTLQPTALVHEAWLRLRNQARNGFRDESHFLAVAAVVIRHVVIDHARTKARRKRGGGAMVLALDDDVAAVGTDPAQLLELEEALQELARLDDRKAKVVELRVFGGATIEETAKCLGISHMTVTSDWRMARAWLATRFRR